MTWNGNGVFDPPGGPEFPAIPDDLIRAAYYNTVIQALCDGFLNAMPRDGQAPMTGNMNGNSLFTLTNMRAAAAAGEAVRFEEFSALAAEVSAIGTPVEPFVYQNMGII